MNLPIDFNQYRRVLLLGIGGGYDVFGGLPLCSGNWVFANYNMHLTRMQSASEMPDYHPEARLHKWLGGQCEVYGLPRMGVRYLSSCLRKICTDHDIDCVVMIDGGVDSLMHGDEVDHGTIIEDTLMMAAAADLPVVKYLVCMGFGTELEDGLCHHHALKNISQAIKDGGFIGSCSLTQSPEFSKYKEACEFAWNGRRASHIQTKVISAVQGEFGDVNLYDGVDAQIAGSVGVKNYLTPLMGVYWFFHFLPVFSRNVLAKTLSASNTHTDALMLFRQHVFHKKSQSLPY